MQIARSISAALVTLGLMVPFGGLAQDATAPPETPGENAASVDLPLGEDVAEDATPGKTYTREVFGDWEMRCVLTEDGKDPCQLYQLMKNQSGNPVAEISLFELPPDQAAVAGATIATPLETLLTRQLTLSVDGRNSKRYPFSYCSNAGCYVRLGLTAEDIAAFKRGISATVSIVPVSTPDRPAQLRLSLTGFTKGFAAIVSSNAANRADQQ